MPLNKNFSDALNANPRLPRVWFSRPSSSVQRADFVDTLLQALQANVDLVYIASIELDHLDRQAAERIAWLRAKTYSLAKQPSDADIVGALGEWAVLRDIGMDPSITSVSLVSFSPVPEPDFLVKQTDPTTGITVTALFDIKTTASLTQPGFVYDPAKHLAKGDPHILGLRLSDTWQKADSADIFLTRANKLISLNQYQTFKGTGAKQCVGSLNGKLI